jgi:integrase
MADKLTDRTIGKLAKPTSGNKLYFDAEVSGLAVRVTAAGAKSFVVCYRNGGGRQRRFTVGGFGEWTIGAARAEARELKRRIDQGDDPMGQRQADRGAPTVADLCERFIDEHLPKKRPITARDYRPIINKQILPKLCNVKVADVTFADVDGFHRRITKSGAAYQANRTVAVLSKMFSLAIKWGYRTDNPAKGIERNDEHKRERYLTPDEMTRLGEALTRCADRQGAAILGLLFLTGARSGETRSMRWADLDLRAGIWVKPATNTKQRKPHRIPLSAPAIALLKALRAEADKGAEFVFPGRLGGHRVEIKKTWIWITKAAHLKDMRVHDLRHSYASILASSGHSLPTIGKLLGHTNPVTTQRYAHLADDPLRAATEKAGEIIAGK